MTLDPEQAAAAETRVVDMVFPAESNHYGTLFGGQATAMMDRAAYVAATRYRRRTLATVAVENITFHHPVPQGDIIEIIAKIAAAGNRSTTVSVELFGEALLTGERHLCVTGRFIFADKGEKGG